MQKEHCWRNGILCQLTQISIGISCSYLRSVYLEQNLRVGNLYNQVIRGPVRIVLFTHLLWCLDKKYKCIKQTNKHTQSIIFLQWVICWFSFKLYKNIYIQTKLHLRFLIGLGGLTIMDLCWVKWKLLSRLVASSAESIIQGDTDKNKQGKYDCIALLMFIKQHMYQKGKIRNLIVFFLYFSFFLLLRILILVKVALFSLKWKVCMCVSSITILWRL